MRSIGSKTMAMRVVQEAEGWLGTPYRHQGSRKGVGCDCLGLVRGVWRNVYGSEAEDPGAYTPDWVETQENDIFLESVKRLFISKPIETLEPGDLVLFRWKAGLSTKHAAIMIRSQRFVHACEGRCVTAAFLIHQWVQRISGVFSFPECLEG